MFKVMPTPTYKVLSIDWDYFMGCSAEKRARLFPDGGNEDLMESVLDFIWMNHYANSSELSLIEVDQSAVNFIQNYIQTTCAGSPMFVYDSHAHIYDRILEYKPIGWDLQVVNVDFHHDCYTFSEQLDCGNWGGKLSNLFDVDNYELYWVKRPDSEDEACGILEAGIRGLEIKPAEFLHPIYLPDLNRMKDIHYDMLYICRSGCWSAPHLDSEFKQFVSFCKKVCMERVIEDKVMENRYSSNFCKAVEESAKAYKLFHNNLGSALKVLHDDKEFKED